MTPSNQEPHDCWNFNQESTNFHLTQLLLRNTISVSNVVKNSVPTTVLLLIRPLNVQRVFAIGRKEKFNFHYSLQLTFGSSPHHVSMYQHQVEAYFQAKKMSVPTDEDELVVTMLCDDITTLLCNSHNTCFGVKV